MESTNNSQSSPQKTGLLDEERSVELLSHSRLSSLLSYLSFFLKRQRTNGLSDVFSANKERPEECRDPIRDEKDGVSAQLLKTGSDIASKHQKTTHRHWLYKNTKFYYAVGYFFFKTIFGTLGFVQISKKCKIWKEPVMYIIWILNSKVQFAF